MVIEDRIRALEERASNLENTMESIVRLMNRILSLEEQTVTMMDTVSGILKSINERMDSIEQTVQTNFDTLTRSIQQNHENVMKELGRIASGGALN